MSMKYISQIRSNLKKYKTIHTDKETSRILDGSYKSVYKGRSMNFDELREYAPGDDVKDIDWKAYARSRRLLVRQYIAEKKHNIMFVMDANRRMLADTVGNQEKREVALMSAGTLAYLVNQNGDYISAMFSAEEMMCHFPFRMGLMNIEYILEHYYKSVTMNNHSDIDRTLDYLVHNCRRKMILVIVTDITGIYQMTETTLRQLLVMNDVLIINVSDSDMYGRQVYNVEGGGYMPEFLTANKKLARRQEAKRQMVHDVCMEKLKRLGVSVVTVDGIEEIDTKLMELLNKHKNEKR